MFNVRIIWQHLYSKLFAVACFIFFDRIQNNRFFDGRQQAAHDYGRDITELTVVIQLKPFFSHVWIKLSDFELQLIWHE